MKTKLMMLAALVAAPAYADVTLETWGGSYSAAQLEAYTKPFTKESGVAVKIVDSEDPAGPLKVQTEAGNVTSDVFDVDSATALRMCEEGVLRPWRIEELPPGAGGEPAEADFLPGSMMECGVPMYMWSTIIAYDPEKFDTQPSTAADFFDVEKFPGKRGLPNNAKRTLYLALVADGVPGDQVFDVLRTPEGVDRAFAKLDTIKPHVVWWETGAQPGQLLADGEVTMATLYNGRLFTMNVDEGQDFRPIWDGQHLDTQVLVIPNDAPNMDEAVEFVKFATAAEQQAVFTQHISYGPVRKSSWPLVDVYKDGTTKMAEHMPTNEANLTNAVVDEPEFWADHGAELEERFSAWLVKS